MFYKKDVFKISQNSQENTCSRVSFLILFKRTTYVESHAVISKAETNNPLRQNKPIVDCLKQRSIDKKLSSWLTDFGR